ncbi:hypothetical protein R83H12_00162 [Fibrobacteria bacterium R8-3-H12]
MLMLNFIDLLAGIGSLSENLARAGLKPLVHIELRKNQEIKVGKTTIIM